MDSNISVEVSRRCARCKVYNPVFSRKKNGNEFKLCDYCRLYLREHHRKYYGVSDESIRKK